MKIDLSQRCASIRDNYYNFLKFITDLRYYRLTLVSLFLVIAGYYFFAWPIVAYDTDLWYHLFGGRYFSENGTIADSSFFSYITPEKSWYNYYWLFQVVIYKIHQWSGYYGLVVLRGLLYILTVLMIYLSLVRSRRTGTKELAGLLLTVSYALAMISRELVVRPHLFSYFFIVLFLYVLEFKRNRAWVLPLVGVLWANLHGIEYPVMYLIVFAYLAEAFWRQLKKVPDPGVRAKVFNWSLICVFYTVFFTPGLTDLIRTPFGVSLQYSAYQYLYVIELLPIPLKNLFVFAPVTAKGVISTLHNLIVLLVAVSFLIGLVARKLRFSHAILVMGAFALLSKYNRFFYEFALLSIPFLYHSLRSFSEKLELKPLAIGLALPLVAILLPVLVYQGVLGDRPAYPFSSSYLPTGVVRFLNRHTPGGKILNEANSGGYLPWALGDRFKIFMDMEMAIFTDLDFATMQSAFSDGNAFLAFISKYDPPFISASLNRSYFPDVVAKDPRFVPVFFDQAEVLYINRDRYGELTRKYALKAIDPFKYREIDYQDLDESQLGQIAVEAARMTEDDPENYSAHHILASVAIVRKNYDEALVHAGVLIKFFPEISHGYALKGDARFGLGHYEEAAALYEKALAMGQTIKSEKVYWNLHAAYAKLNEFRKAYQLLSKYVNPFAIKADYKEIYQLAISAASVGKTSEAILYLEIARQKIPATDADYTKKVQDGLAMLSD